MWLAVGHIDMRRGMNGLALQVQQALGRDPHAGDLYPRYIAGEGNAPPEDCGGIPGFYEKLDIAADPSSPEHNEIRQWLGDYDPHVIDELQIKISLGRIAKHRNAAKAQIKKQAT